MKKKIDRFTIQDVLSESGSGSVYKAQEQLPGDVSRVVALKLLPAVAEGDAHAQQRLSEQMRLCVALAGHPNVVTFYSMGLAGRVPWIAMEYLPSALSQSLSEQPIAAEQVAAMMRDVARGLLALHSLTPAVLHNDLSPSNILIDAFGRHKISDFGLATPAGVERTRVMASVKYAAPELLSRELGPLAPATDLYALGHIAYEMALGGKLYRQQFPAVYDPRGGGKDASPAKWMAWHCSMNTLPPAVQELRADFPADLGGIIARLMRKAAAERYATAESLLAELKQFDQPRPAAAMPPPIPPAAVVSPPGSAPSAPAMSAAAPAPSAASALPAPAHAAAAAVAAERYFVRLGGRVTGPFDLSALQQQARRGLLSRLHQVSRDRISWHSAATVEGLFRAGGEEAT